MNGLKKPYQYALPMKEAELLVRDLQEILNYYIGSKKISGDCYYKRISKGIRINIYFSPNRSEYIGGKNPDCAIIKTTLSKKEWLNIAENINKLLKTRIPAANIHVTNMIYDYYAYNPYVYKSSGGWFALGTKYFRAETVIYIMYSELNT